MPRRSKASGAAMSLHYEKANSGHEAIGELQKAPRNLRHQGATAQESCGYKLYALYFDNRERLTRHQATATLHPPLVTSSLRFPRLDSAFFLLDRTSLRSLNHVIGHLGVRDQIFQHYDSDVHCCFDVVERGGQGAHAGLGKLIAYESVSIASHHVQASLQPLKTASHILKFGQRWKYGKGDSFKVSYQIRQPNPHLFYSFFEHQPPERHPCGDADKPKAKALESHFSVNQSDPRLLRPVLLHLPKWQQHCVHGRSSRKPTTNGRDRCPVESAFRAEPETWDHYLSYKHASPPVDLPPFCHGHDPRDALP